MSFAENMSRNIDKNTSKSLNNKYSQKRYAHAKQSVTYAFKTSSKKVIQKTAEATGDLIEIKIADKITKTLKHLSTK